MKTLQKPHTWLSLMLAFSFAACSLFQTEEEIVTQPPVLVELTELEKTTLQNDLRVMGTVEAYEEAFIAAATPARIERIYVDVGDEVTKGQLLVQMDRTQLFQAKVQLDNLRQDLRRLDTLLTIGAVTQQQFDQLKTQYEVAQSNVENLEKLTQIRATIPGTITGRYNSEGELFTMSPSTPEGKPAILSLKQMQPVKINIGVSERFFTSVKEGQEASILLDIYPERAFRGKVYKIYPVIDRRTGSFQVALLVENHDMALRHGMYARVSLELGEIEGLLVPSLAVRKQVGSDERFVFVVENGLAQRRVVRLGRTFDDQVEILSGIREGEMLVTVGQHNMRDQSEVEIVNQ